MGTIDYIDRARHATGTSSDYALAKLLGIDDSAMQHYRHGRRVMDAYTAAKLAQVLKLNPLEVIAAAEAERAKDTQKRAFWETHLKKFARRAPAGLAAILGLPFILTTASTSDAAGMTTAWRQDNVLSIMRTLRRLLATLRTLAQTGKDAARILVRTPTLPTPQATT